MYFCTTHLLSLAGGWSAATSSRISSTWFMHTMSARAPLSPSPSVLPWTPGAHAQGPCPRGQGRSQGSPLAHAPRAARGFREDVRSGRAELQTEPCEATLAEPWTGWVERGAAGAEGGVGERGAGVAAGSRGQTACGLRKPAGSAGAVEARGSGGSHPG